MRKSTQAEDVRRRVSPSANLDAVMSLVEPSCGDSAVLTADDSVVFHRHQLEQEVRNRLMAEPSLNFTSLVVRRVRSGLCLEGVLEADDAEAALALLGGKGKGLSGGLTEALGLDELSVRGGASNSDGSTTGGATVTLGKRVSRDFYVAYERSLAGTLGTLSIFYDLSRRFTLRAQTGAQSAVDLIFTLRYD